jgi:hypothetical protein
MYKIIPTNSVPYNPAPLRVGLPVTEDTKPNLIIVSSNNSNVLALNATVLRESLLNSSLLLKDCLGLEVKDLRKEPVEPKKKKTSKVKEVTTEEPHKTEKIIIEKPVEVPSNISKEEDEWV